MEDARDNPSGQEDGPPYPRPKGKGIRGKKWDAQTNKWVKQKKQKTAPETEQPAADADADADAGAQTSTAMVVYNPGAAAGEGGAEVQGTGSSEEAEGNESLGVTAALVHDGQGESIDFFEGLLQ